jgi:SusD family.
MKKYCKLITVAIISASLNLSCNESEFLKEVPLDFLSPENAFVTNADFQSALTDIYVKVRDLYSISGDGGNEYNFYGTDIAYNARRDANSRVGDYNNRIIPEGYLPRVVWQGWYKVISNANTIISRLPDTKLTSEEQNEIRAEAMLFRAWAYRDLVHLYGGVPLIIEETASPRADYVRASREQVLNQIIMDATEAATYLGEISSVKDGKLSKPVAWHLLAETYIVLGEYDKAIAAADNAIDKSGLSLMRNRFGSLRNEPGDVYSDLFKVNNQNRAQGNTESIWVIQYELDVPGGVITSAGVNFNMLERQLGPCVYTVTAPDGKPGIINATSTSTLQSGGRGVGLGRTTDYFLYDIWGLNPNDDNRIVTNPDIRTSAFNIVRDFIYNDPSSDYFGKSIIDFPSENNIGENDWRWYPFPSKGTTPGQHPSALIVDPTHLTLRSTAGATFRDMYLIRLAETYLLRAEAYLMKGDKANAAKDINEVRNRANAFPVNASEVDLDYILDERARELTFEESRRITLSRMNVLVERVRKYNPLNKDNINDYNNLFPIPFVEIETNKDAVLEQNPGYN